MLTDDAYGFLRPLGLGVLTTVLVLVPRLHDGDWHRVVGGADHPPVPIAVVALACVVAAVVPVVVRLRAREREPAYPLAYAPPADIGPAQGALAYDKALSARLYAATLLQVGQQDLATVRHDVDGWTAIGGNGDWSRTDPITRRIGLELGIDRPGGTFVFRRGDPHARKALAAGRRRLDEWLSAWVEKRGILLERGSVEVAGVLAILLGYVGAYVAYHRPFSMSLLAAPFAVYAFAAVPLFRPGVAVERTPRGRDLAVKVGGFRRVLATQSAGGRFDFSGRERYYVEYLPWAVALGVAREWERSYRGQVGLRPAEPTSYNDGISIGEILLLVDSFHDSRVYAFLRGLVPFHSRRRAG